MTRILIFSGRHDLPSDARAFSFLAPLEIQSSSLRLKGSRLLYFSKVPPGFEEFSAIFFVSVNVTFSCNCVLSRWAAKSEEKRMFYVSP